MRKAGVCNNLLAQKENRQFKTADLVLASAQKHSQRTKLVRIVAIFSHPFRLFNQLYGNILHITREVARTRETGGIFGVKRARLILVKRLIDHLLMKEGKIHDNDGVFDTY